MWPFELGICLHCLGTATSVHGRGGSLLLILLNLDFGFGNGPVLIATGDPMDRRRTDHLAWREQYRACFLGVLS